MLRHVIIWRYKEGFTDAENAENAARLKETLESLPAKIPEIIELKVHINDLASSNADILLDSLFKDEKDLETYIKHPAHVKAGQFVRSVTQDRACVDYYE